MRNAVRRFALVVGIGFGFGFGFGIVFGAHAADAADAFAVVALVGDSITVVQYRPSTAGRADQNAVTRVPMEDGHFDETATRAALNTLGRVRPQSQAQAVTVAEQASFGDGETIFASGGTLPALLKAVEPSLEQSQVRYLIVISKYRGDAQLRIATGSIGQGHLSGLGFYVDPYKGMVNTSSGESGRGFIAPYAYVRVDLVDRSTGSVVRTETATETATRANVGAGSDQNPWNALPADAKVRMLDGLLARAVRTTVARVAAPT